MHERPHHVHRQVTIGTRTVRRQTEDRSKARSTVAKTLDRSGNRGCHIFEIFYAWHLSRQTVNLVAFLSIYWRLFDSVCHSCPSVNAKRGKGGWDQNFNETTR